MTISGELLAPGGNTPATFQNMNADALRLSNGGTVLAYLKQTGGDAITWVPSGPMFDGVLKVMDATNHVVKSISLVDSLVPAGRAVNDLTVERLANGGFVVAWSDIAPADEAWTGLRTRYAIYDDAGNLQANGDLSSTPGYNVRITALANGGFATVSAVANGTAHPGQGLVNTFSYNAGTYVKGTETYVGDQNAAAPGANADIGKLWMFDEFSITGLSDGGFVIGAPTYDYVSSTYTPLGDFVFRYAANGAQTPFASGAYWQRVNWNDGQVNNAVLTKSFAGGFASVNRGKNGQWQVTMFHNDGSLITATQKTQTVTEDSGRIVHTKTYYATDIVGVASYAASNGLDYDDFIDIAVINGELVVVLPNASKGFSLAKLSTTDGSVISVTDLGITVPAGATLMNPRILAEGSGWDLSYDVMSIDGDGYYHQSTYQIGLSAPTNQAPLVDNIAGDATSFILGTPEYIDAGAYADVADPDSADFNGGYLEVKQTAGTANGDFSFDLGDGVTEILWGSGAAPDLSSDGTSFASPGPLAVGDKVWYSAGSSSDPSAWILVGTVAGDGQDGATLKIAFSNPALAVPSALGTAESFAAALLKYLMYTAPTLGARSFEVRIADGDGAVSTAVSFGMTGTSDQSSTITAAAGVTEPAKLPISATTPAGAVGVLDFTITDAGNADGLATRVDGLVLQTSGTGDFSKVTWLLTGPGIGTPVTGSYNAGAHTLSFAGTAISVADGASAVYTVKAYFNSTSGVSAGATYLLSLDGDSGVNLATGMSSQMAPTQSPVTTGSGILVVSGPRVLGVEHASPTSSLTNADSLSWTVRFSEAVSQIDAADFDVTGLSGETIGVTSAGGNAYTVTVSGGGLASLDGSVTLGLAAGQNIVNGDGQPLASLAPSGTDQRSYLLDNSAPAAPSVPDMLAAGDSGRSDTDDRTSNLTPTFTGTAETGATVTLVVDGDVMGTVTATGGSWTFTVPQLAPGNHNIHAYATDAAGNIGAASSDLAFTIDTSVAAPTLALHADTGSAADDGRSKDGRIDVVLAADVASWEYSTNGGGSWQAGSGTSFTLVAGSYAAGQVRVRQTDIAGNISAAAANATALDIDTSVDAPGFALADDSGASASDGVTRDGAVDVSLASDVAGWEYSTNGGGSWQAGSGTSFTLSAGSYAAGAIQVRQTDSAGNLSLAASNAGAIVVDQGAAAPGLALAADTGASAVDGITRNATLDVTLEAGASWEYRIGSGAWTAGSGSSFTLAEGSYAAGAVQVRQTDLAGNVSAASANPAAIVVDLSVPAPTLALANDTGASAGDGITRDGTVNVGLAADVASWEYRTSLGGAWNAGSGTSFTLAPGSYAAGEVQVRQTDVAGNVSAAVASSAALNVLAAPAAPGMALAVDSGASAGDGITANGLVNLTLAAGAVAWEYRIGSGAWTAGSGTSFTLSAGSYAAGAIQVRQTDSAGNLSLAASNAGAIVVDQGAAAPGLALAADTGADASDGITSNATVNVTLEAGASWEYRIGSGAWTAGSGSSFALAEGSYAAGAVQVRQTDLAGNVSAASANPAAIVVDLGVPAPTLALANDTGDSASDGITRDGAVNVGLAADVASWEYRTSLGGAWNAGSGASFTLAPGSYAAGEVQVRQTDLAGNVSSANAPALTIEAPPAPPAQPAPPPAPGIALAVDSGASAADGITASGAVRVSLSPIAVAWEYRIGDGAWTAGSGTGFTLASGSYAAGAVQVRQSDVFGNASAAGVNGAAITVDTARPVIDTLTYPFLANPTGNQSLLIEVGYLDVGAGIDAATIGASDLALTRAGAPAPLKVSAVHWDAATGVASYTVDAPAGGWSAAYAGSWTIAVAADAVRDLAGNALAGGIAQPFSIAFNTAPVITSNGGGASAAIDIAEGSTAVTTVTAIDADPGDTLAYRISGGADAARFGIDAASGALRLLSPQAPGDTAYRVDVTVTDAHGASATQALAVRVLRDTDGDGTSDTADNDLDGDGRANSAEDPVPGLRGGTGDGNGDGIADSLQVNVASLATVGSVPAEKRFATIAVDEGLTLAGVSNSAAPGSLPRNAKMPLGQFDFEIRGVTVGATVEIRLYVDKTLGANGYYKQTASGWVNLATASTAGDKTMLTFSLTDGGAFDADGVANGVIVDPGGVAVLAPRIVSAGGQPAATVQVAENQREVTTVHAEAAGAVAYAITGGLDAARFAIDAATGALRFVAAPDYEAPRDLGDGAANNTYVVEVTASDAVGSDTQVLTVRVQDLLEGPDGDRDGFPDALEVAHGLQVGVKDNDVFGSNKLFVMELYRDLLFREARSSEWGFWQGVLDGGGMDRAQLVSSFLDSAEFQGGAGALTRLYAAAFDRLPDASGLAFWTGQVGAGQPLAALAGELVASSEFMATYGQLDDAGFVRQLYRNVMEREGDAAGVGFWTARLADGLARGDVLLGFAQSAEFRGATDHAVTAALGYLGLLGRDPAAREVDYWVEKLDAGVPETVVIGQFLGVPEYHDRFLPELR